MTNRVFMSDSRKKTAFIEVDGRMWFSPTNFMARMGVRRGLFDNLNTSYRLPRKSTRIDLVYRDGRCQPNLKIAPVTELPEMLMKASSRSKMIENPKFRSELAEYQRPGKGLASTGTHGPQFIHRVDPTLMSDMAKEIDEADRIVPEEEIADSVGELMEESECNVPGDASEILEQIIKMRTHETKMLDMIERIDEKRKEMAHALNSTQSNIQAAKAKLVDLL